MTRSFQPGYYLSAGPGSLPISGVYHVSASIGNDKVTETMEPQLHVPKDGAVRFLILFSADMTGFINPKFTFRILLKEGGRTLSQVGPFKLSFTQLTKSFKETKKELERRIAASPNDVPTLLRYGKTLEVEFDTSQARSIYSKIHQLDPDNGDGITFFVRDNSTPKDKRIELYYHLESLDREKSSECSGSVADLLIESAKEQWKRNEESDYRNTLVEARRLVQKSTWHSSLEPVLEEEILLSVHDGQIELAKQKIAKLAELQHWHEKGRGWQKDVLERRLSDTFSTNWNENLKNELFKNILRS